MGRSCPSRSKHVCEPWKSWQQTRDDCASGTGNDDNPDGPESERGDTHRHSRLGLCRGVCWSSQESRISNQSSTITLTDSFSIRCVDCLKAKSHRGYLDILLSGFV